MLRKRWTLRFEQRGDDENDGPTPQAVRCKILTLQVKCMLSLRRRCQHTDFVCWGIASARSAPSLQAPCPCSGTSPGMKITHHSRGGGRGTARWAVLPIFVMPSMCCRRHSSTSRPRTSSAAALPCPAVLHHPNSRLLESACASHSRAASRQQARDDNCIPEGNQQA